MAALLARLDGGKDAPGGRELMFNVLRRMPGEAVERRLVAEAKRVGQPAMRTMAIESLAARPSDTGLAALGDIARNDPELSGAAADRGAARSRGHVDGAARRDGVLAAHAGDVRAGVDARSARGAPCSRTW